MEKAKFVAMAAASRKKINRDLHSYICRSYHEAIPISRINDILKVHAKGMELLQEDFAPWSGFLCGDAATCSFDIGMDGGEVMAKNQLYLQWYKMPSGRYEVTCYVS